MRPLRLLFLGGTGVISRACVSEALARGHEVHVLNRGTSSVRTVPEGAIEHRGDVRDPATIVPVIRGPEFDAVAQFLAFQPDDIERDVQTFLGRTRQYVFVSSASAYQTPPRSLPVTESTPLHNPYWSYSRAKIASEERLIAAYRAHEFPATIVRPSHTYDATMPPFDGGWTVVDRMRRGLEVVVPGDGTSLWTITHARDFARGFVGLLGRSEAIGEAFHITGDEAPTWNAIYAEIARAAGVEARVVHVASEAIAARDPEWGAALLGDKANTMLFDNAKLRRLVPGFAATTPFARGAEEILAWFDAHPAAQQVDPRWNEVMDDLVNDYRPRTFASAEAVGA